MTLLLHRVPASWEVADSFYTGANLDELTDVLLFCYGRNWYRWVWFVFCVLKPHPRDERQQICVTCYCSDQYRWPHVIHRQVCCRLNTGLTQHGQRVETMKQSWQWNGLYSYYAFTLVVVYFIWWTIVKVLTPLTTPTPIKNKVLNDGVMYPWSSDELWRGQARDWYTQHKKYPKAKTNLEQKATFIHYMSMLGLKMALL